MSEARENDPVPWLRRCETVIWYARDVRLRVEGLIRRALRRECTVSVKRQRARRDVVLVSLTRLVSPVVMCTGSRSDAWTLVYVRASRVVVQRKLSYSLPLAVYISTRDIYVTYRKERPIGAIGAVRARAGTRARLSCHA